MARASRRMTASCMECRGVDAPDSIVRGGVRSPRVGERWCERNSSRVVHRLRLARDLMVGAPTVQWHVSPPSSPHRADAHQRAHKQDHVLREGRELRRRDVVWEEARGGRRSPWSAEQARCAIGPVCRVCPCLVTLGSAVLQMILYLVSIAAPASRRLASCGFCHSTEFTLLDSRPERVMIMTFFLSRSGDTFDHMTFDVYTFRRHVRSHFR